VGALTEIALVYSNFHDVAMKLNLYVGPKDRMAPHL